MKELPMARKNIISEYYERILKEPNLNRIKYISS
jgi:hypothetical protein